MTLVCTLAGGPEAPLWDRIKSGGTKAQQALRSWLTGGLPPALNLGFFGAGSATSVTAAANGLFSVDRLTRQCRSVVATRGVASGLLGRNIERLARRHGRMDTIRAPGSIGLSASHGMAATHGRRAGFTCGFAQLGSIASDLQPAWRAQRRNARAHQIGSTYFERAILRASLCQHALRQRVLFAGAPRREAPEIRSLRLRAFP